MLTKERKEPFGSSGTHPGIHLQEQGNERTAQIKQKKYTRRSAMINVITRNQSKRSMSATLPKYPTPLRTRGWCASRSWHSRGAGPRASRLAWWLLLRPDPPATGTPMTSARFQTPTPESEQKRKSHTSTCTRKRRKEA